MISIFRLLTFAAEDDNVELFNKFKGRINKNNIRRCAILAAEYGSMNVIHHLLEKGLRNFNWIAVGAAKGGHRDIVLDMTERMKDNNCCANILSVIAESAAREGHIDIVKDMLNFGANNFNEITITGAKSGRKRVVLKYIDSVTDIHTLLEAVIWRGYKDVAFKILNENTITINSDLIKKVIDSDLDDLVYRLLLHIDDLKVVIDYANKVRRRDLAKEIESE